ncbi:hypothetical protein ACOZGD_35045 [Streptomyces murinus]
MRLCTTRPPASRTWTVELRPQPQGPRLVCAQCGLTPETLQGRTARSAALAHLARHARLSLLPQHLRTCQCHERGCRWHPRHRGCDGPLLLVLSREHGGRLWRLADSCTACAQAMKDACIVPDTTLTMPPAARRANGPVTASRRPAGLEDVDRSLVRDMLSYLAISLPAGVSPQARLVALQCVLRATPDGRVRLPAGLIRGMGLLQPEGARQELADSGWLCQGSSAGDTADSRLTDPLFGGAGRRQRARAADWSLRVGHRHGGAGLTVAVRLVSLALAAHTPTGTTAGRAEADQVARRCGLPPEELISTLRLLAARQTITSWELASDSGDLTWRYASG